MRGAPQLEDPELPEARVERLAREFLELHGRDPRPWPPLLATWARGLRLGESVTRAVRIRVLGLRNFTEVAR